MLLGVRAVIAESFERIHRSNLIGMGVLPLQFRDGESAETPRAHRHRTLHGLRPRRDRTTTIRYPPSSPCAPNRTAVSPSSST